MFKSALAVETKRQKGSKKGRAPDSYGQHQVSCGDAQNWALGRRALAEGSMGTSTATSKLIDEATLTDAQRLKGGVDVDGGSISTTAPPSSNSKDISGSSVAGIVVGLCVLVAVVGVGIVLRNHLEKPAPRKSADSRGGSFDVHSVMFGGVAGEEGGQSTSTSPRKAGSSYSLNNPRKIQVRSSVFEVNQTSCA